jgi:hypothetical protein
MVKKRIIRMPKLPDILESREPVSNPENFSVEPNEFQKSLKELFGEDRDTSDDFVIKKVIPLVNPVFEDEVVDEPESSEAFNNQIKDLLKTRSNPDTLEPIKITEVIGKVLVVKNILPNRNHKVVCGRNNVPVNRSCNMVSGNRTI